MKSNNIKEQFMEEWNKMDMLTERIYFVLMIIGSILFFSGGILGYDFINMIGFSLMFPLSITLGIIQILKKYKIVGNKIH